MGRAANSKDRRPRTRRKSTTAEVQQRASKKLAEDSHRRQVDARAAQVAKARLFGGGAAGAGSSNGAASASEDGGGSSHGDGGASINEDGEFDDGDFGWDEDEEVRPDRNSEADGAARKDVRPDDVEADLDEDDDLDGADAVGGVMNMYLKVVFERLHSETCGAASRAPLEEKWLLDLLRRESSNWWLRADLEILILAPIAQPARSRGMIADGMARVSPPGGQHRVRLAHPSWLLLSRVGVPGPFRWLYSV